MADKVKLSVNEFTLEDKVVVKEGGIATLGATMTVSPEAAAESGFLSGQLKKADGTVVNIQIPFYLA